MLNCKLVFALLKGITIKGVGEAVDLDNVLLGERGDSAEIVVVQQAVLPLADGHGQMLK